MRARKKHKGSWLGVGLDREVEFSCQVDKREEFNAICTSPPL